MIRLVKICGVTTKEAMDAAVAAGADAVGFVFHAPSPRDIAPRHAAALARGRPRGMLCVAVTMQPTQALVDRILEEMTPDVWQSDAADFDAMRIPASIERWPVLRQWAAGSKRPGRVLFESSSSGSGMRADWSTARVMARTGELILGGGLDANNVGDAIAAVHPFGVDVSSGVERAPGVKDARRIHEFIIAARMAVQAASA
jgi:phosphoribosylanthranilate isomerase